MNSGEQEPIPTDRILTVPNVLSIVRLLALPLFAYLLLVTLVAGALVAGIGTLLSSVSFFFVFVFALLAWAVVFYGANAVGMMVMDEARGERSRLADFASDVL